MCEGSPNAHPHLSRGTDAVETVAANRAAIDRTAAAGKLAHLRGSRGVRVGRYSLPGNRFLSGFRHYNNEKPLKKLEAVLAQALTYGLGKAVALLEVQLGLLFPCCCTQT